MSNPCDFGICDPFNCRDSFCFPKSVGKVREDSPTTPSNDYPNVSKEEKAAYNKGASQYAKEHKTN